MSTEQNDRIEPKESQESNFDSSSSESTSALQNEASKLLFENRDLFNSQSKDTGNWNSRSVDSWHGSDSKTVTTAIGNPNDSGRGTPLPDLQIVGMENVAVAYASNKGGEKTQAGSDAGKSKSGASNTTSDFSVATLDKELRESGMVPRPQESGSNKTVYEPANPNDPRKMVEVFANGENVREERVTFRDGSTASKELDNDGKTISRTYTDRNGVQTTKWSDMKATSETLADAYKNGGTEGLKKAIEDAMADPKCSKDRMAKMLAELKTHGVDTYMKGDTIHMNDGWFGREGTALGKQRTAPPQETPSEQTKPSEAHPATNAPPNRWSNIISDAVKPKSK